MKFLLNIIFAWISVVLVLSLIIIWFIRILNKRFNKADDGFWGKVNRWLRKKHIVAGVLMAVTSLVHGLLSSYNVFSINAGTIMLAAAVLLGLTYVFRKRMAGILGWMKWHRILAISLMLLLMVHIVEVGGFVGIGVVEKSIREVLNIKSGYANADMSQNIYRDGKYIGVGTGYRPELTVEVTIEDNKITDIQIVDHHEKHSIYYQRAFNKIPRKIIDEQNTAVDAISGATLSSYGIMEAVNDALSKAMVSGGLPQIDRPDK